MSLVSLLLVGYHLSFLSVCLFLFVIQWAGLFYMVTTIVSLLAPLASFGWLGLLMHIVIIIVFHNLSLYLLCWCSKHCILLSKFQKRNKRETNLEYYCHMLFLECSDNLLKLSVAIALLKRKLYVCVEMIDWLVDLCICGVFATWMFQTKTYLFATPYNIDSSVMQSVWC